MRVQNDLHFQMPDLFFARICEEKYGVNRGIYNTVDEWFFKQGIEEIVERRKTMLTFFDSIKKVENKQGKIKFGPKGLTERLTQFYQQ